MEHGKTLAKALAGSTEEAARRLLGCELVRSWPDGSKSRVRIVETEAYEEHDAASHSFRGRTERNSVMFGPAGRLYVYFTYGMHYCCNVVVGQKGEGAAVLIRAVEPLGATERLEAHRMGKIGVELTNGPAKLCRALGIDRMLNGHDLAEMPLTLQMKKPIPSENIVTTTRIGIRQDTHRLWRFYIAGNEYVSRV